MIQPHRPIFSIIVLNYFGQKIIAKTLDSLLALKFPAKKYEIIVVDNNSTDNSKKIISKYQKKSQIIKTIFLDKNLGFSRGNNVGIKTAKGKYIILLNNDCIVDTNWLTELQKTADSDPKIFAVNSKILLYPRYLFLTITNNPNFYISQCLLTKSQPNNYSKDRRSLPLFFEPTKDNYSVEVPFIPNDSHVCLDIKIHLTSPSAIIPRDIKTNLTNTRPTVVKKRKKYLILRLTVKMSKNVFKQSYNLIQNAGSLVFQDGYGRDIGASVKHHHQYYEKDIGQYSKTRPVYSVCGAASLFRKDLLDKIGLLNEHFFMYYEDTEISERARLAGYKNVYCPTAIVRHLHAFSSSEWSNFFIYHVEKGRLLHLFYHFPISVFITEFLTFFVASILRFSKNKGQFSKNIQYTRVITAFLFGLPKFLVQKIKYVRLYGPSAVQKNYSTIISGYWYQN